MIDPMFYGLILGFIGGLGVATFIYLGWLKE
jgi:hypothetical protein